MSTYTNVFSGNIIQVTPNSYTAISLSANTTLAWSTQFQDILGTVANIMDVSPTGGGFSLTLPDTTMTGVGTSFILNNPTGTSFTLKRNDGTTLATILATTINLFYLIDNTTAAGTWRDGPFGGGYTAVTSVAATSSTPDIVIGGSPITTSGTFTFALGADLAALAGFNASVGIAARTAATTWSLVTLTGTNNQIVVVNGQGVAGNPTFSLASNITGVATIQVGNIQIGANTISSINTNGNINLAPVGTGMVTVQNGSPLAFYDPANSNYISFAAGNMATNVPLTLPTVAPVATQVLQAVTSTTLGWADVTTFGGPSTVNAIARFSNLIGSLANSGVLLDNSNNITGANSFQVGNINLGVVDSNTIATTNANGNLNLDPNGIGEVYSLSNIGIRLGKSLKIFNAANSAYNFFNAANTNITTGWSLPAFEGAANSMWKTDGAGDLSFSTIIDSYATKAQLQLNPPTSTINPVVPATVQYHLGVAKAWIVFDGTAGGPVAAASYNIASIVKNGTGDYTINFTTAFANTNYTVVGGLNALAILFNASASNTVSAARISTQTYLGVATDYTKISVEFFGNQ
jgi:hypothetical protein